jgi:hypothetical protein
VKNINSLLLVIFLLLPEISCRKVKDYFRDPETEQLEETIHTTVIVGYAANLAFSLMDGHYFPHVNFSRSNAGFPCTTLMVIDMEDDSSLIIAHEKAKTITIAGLWPDESAAILSLAMTDYHAGISTLDLLGIKTIPVVSDGDHINIALASIDIQLNPDQEALLRLNLNTLEIESEFLRLEKPRPKDVYIAVLEDAYYIDVYNNLTRNNNSDDSYTITGGGQLVEVSGSSVEIVQQAMVEVQVSPVCTLNPVDGMALMKVTGIEDKGFPELGTVLLEFMASCGGTAHVFIATGMFAGSTGRNVSFCL